MDFEVIIPTYNRLSYLKQALQSVLAQRPVVPAIKVLDSASSDGTAEFLAALDLPRVQVIRFEDNRGLAGNWTRAFQQATAPFFAVLHDDDLMHPDFVAVHLKLLMDHPEIVFSHTAARLIDSHGLGTGYRRAPWPLITPGDDFVKRLVTQAGCVPIAPSLAFRRELVPTQAAFDPAQPFTLDLKLWIELSRHGSVGYLSEPLIDYRIHPQSETNQLFRRMEQRIQDRLAFERFAREELIQRGIFSPAIAETKMRKYIHGALKADLIGVKRESRSMRTTLSAVRKIVSARSTLLADPNFVLSAAATLLVPYGLAKKVAAMLPRATT